MTAIESTTASAAFPGLDHLRGHVPNWEASVKTLSLTATALAESVGAGAPERRAAPPSQQEPDPRGVGPGSGPALTPVLTRLLLLRPPAPSLLVPPGQLKPGRVFIVTNLQGAYYTLLELLSRNKFDFRSDNLMHLGNLLAPPPPAAATAAAAAAAGGGDGHRPLGGAQPRRFRNSTSVLKLVRRHGGLGPMGANECLALLAAARRNRERVEQEAAAAATEGRRLAGALKAGAIRAPRGRCSALSLQLATGTTAGCAAAAVAVKQCGGGGGRSLSASASSAKATPTPWLGLGLGASDSSHSSDSSDDDEGAGRGEADVEMVDAPLTPHPDDDDVAPTRSSRFAAASLRTGAASPAAAASAFMGPSPDLDDAELGALLSMPASVVLEAYGIQLQHAGPAVDQSEVPAAVAAPPCPAGAASVPGGGYHLLFSHRRPGGLGAGVGVGDGDATATGLASCRGDVVRFAVLPPLRTLQRRSPGFVSRMAAGAAPSRGELMLEVREEPLSELDA